MKHAPISISTLTKSFCKQKVLNQISLTVDHGEVFCLLGPNGSGKTTMINCLLSLLHPDEGEIKIFGETKSTRSNKRIGVVLENDGFFRDMSVQKNLELVCLLKGVSFDRIPEILDKFSLLEHRKKRIKTLSLGMRQRLSFASSLIDDPELIVWDEPYNGLDPSGFELVRQMISEMRNHGKTILISTHLLDQVRKTATKVGLIFNGALKEVLRISEIEKKYSTMEQYYFYHVENQK